MMDFKKIRWKNLPIIMLYILGLAIVAIVEMLSINQNATTGEIDLSLSWQNLTRSMPGLILGYIAIALYTAATIIKEIDKFKSTDEDYLDFVEKISKFSKEVYSPVIFNRYCAHANKQRKINAYKIMMHKKWRKLEKRQKDADYQAWVTYQAEKKTNPNATTINKYCIRREQLEAQTTDEYINENIDRIGVKYDKINAGVVLGGVKTSGEELMEDEYITKNKVGIIVSDRAPSYLMTLSIIAIVSSIGVDAFDINAHWTVILMFLFKMFVKIYAMVNAIFSTIKYAKDYNERVTMKDIRFRYGVCSEHTTWIKQEAARQQKKKEEQKNEQQHDIEESKRGRDNPQGASDGKPDNSGKSRTTGSEPPERSTSAEQLDSDNVGAISEHD